MSSLRYFVLWILSLSFSNASAFSPLLSKSQLALTVSSLRGGDQLPQPVMQPVEPAPETPKKSVPTPAVQQTTATAPGMAAMMSGFLTHVLNAYTYQLDKNPILTKSYTSGVIFGLSDYIAQKFENGSDKSKKMEKKRLLASTLVGLLYFGPAAHYWYEMIFALLPGTSLFSTLQKAFWGQVIFGPSFTCIFFATSLLQAGDFSLGNWAKKIKSDLPGAWLAGAGFWPLVDFVSYSVVPVKWIPLFVNMCSLVWTVYLSIVANRSSRKESTK